MNHDVNDRHHGRAPSQLQVHGHTKAGRLDRVELVGRGSDHPLDLSHGIAQKPQPLSLPCLLFRPAQFEGFEQLLVQVSWSLLHKPRRIWTASSTCLLELTTGTAADQLESRLTTTYGRFGLMNRTWDGIDVDRFYMVAWLM
jgi:hypothetical protein